jgi:hypothetical protein
MSFKTMNSRTKIYASLGIVAGLVAAATLRSAFDDGAEPIVRPSVPVVEGPSVADEESAAGLVPHVVPVQEFFAQARLGTRAFAKDALSLESKWKLASGYVSGTDEHARFLEERFAVHVFSPAALEAVVHSAVTAYLQHLEDVDSQLLVRLQADLSGLPSAQLSLNTDRQGIEQAIDTAMKQAIAAVEADFRDAAGLELVSWVAGEVLTAAALELATSAGVLTAGAASGTVTFGVGLVVGLIVDAIISWIYDAAFDPVGELSRRLDVTLGQLEELILGGDGTAPGLVQRLHDYALRRGQARNVAIRSAVLP